MREILFRGKTIKQKDGVTTGNPIKENMWVYGNLTVGKIEGYKCDMISNKKEIYYINSETIGQFTGLTDKNGKKIFEGDIVVTRYSNGEICSIGDVQFDYGVFGAEWTAHKKHKTMVGGWGQLHNLRRFDDDIINHVEVIGNIYDNPELLGE